MYGEFAADRRAVDPIVDIVDALDTGVIVLDGVGVAVSANESACRILGVPASGIVGRRPPYLGDCQAFLEDGRRLNAASDPALATLRDRTERRDVLMRRFEAESGETTWVSATCRPLDVGVVCTITDVTARRAAERNLRQERDRAERYLEMAGTVILVLNAKGEIAVFNRAGH